MGNLVAPIKSKLFERRGNEHFEVSAAAMQGYRKDMEDRHVLKLTLSNHKNMALFGVFDGHNGKEHPFHSRKEQNNPTQAREQPSILAGG